MWKQAQQTRSKVFHRNTGWNPDTQGRLGAKFLSVRLVTLIFKPFIFLTLNWGLQKNYLLAAVVNKNLSLTFKSRISLVHLLWTEEEHACLLILAQDEVTCMVAYGNISSPLRYHSLSLCHWADAVQLSGARGVPQRCRRGSLAWHLSMSANAQCALQKRLPLCAIGLLLPFSSRRWQ